MKSLLVLILISLLISGCSKVLDEEMRYIFSSMTAEAPIYEPGQLRFKILDPPICGIRLGEPIQGVAQRMKVVAFPHPNLTTDSVPYDANVYSIHEGSGTTACTVATINDQVVRIMAIVTANPEDSGIYRIFTKKIRNTYRITKETPIEKGECDFVAEIDGERVGIHLWSMEGSVMLDFEYLSATHFLERYRDDRLLGTCDGVSILESEANQRVNEIRALKALRRRQKGMF